ncbi:PPE family protein [Mycobacterium lacus]|uniref:PPE family protein n=1 Tax=Mycobacterium lacus TaxID=169765 RepID=A0A1X1XMT4_9MYCO|nr:PPE family protein [Mycobacterium lacus]ORW00100.1 hypothetical protein AWC15_09455 [Mycobacterium lacus]BBX97496.1 PPE family protein [Mycobacterium lacus]
MDFAALPPEINSGRMYTGAGCGPMLAAATAWEGLAAELSTAAGNYASVVTDLAGGPWRGPASVAMAAAAAGYVQWVGSTAAQAARAAVQAKAAAGAYEAAFAMTVPPPAIAANRALLASLVATNLFGQNTPAIAATEAQYAEMWAQDAAAMYGYAGSSATASALTPFTDPPPTTSAQTAALTQTVATTGNAGTQATLARLMSAVPGALQGLAAPTSTVQLGDLKNWLGLGGIDLTTPTGLLAFLNGSDGSPVGTFLNAIEMNALSSGFYTPGNFFGTMCDFIGLSGAGAAAEAAEGAAEAAATGLGDAVPGMGGLGGAVSAGVGNAASIGPLSVPPSWTATTPLGAAGSALPNGAAGAPAVGGGPSSMLGGMPLTGSSGRGFAEAPRYGFRPTVVTHPPAAG